MEANFFRHLAAELAELLPGRRVGKVFAPAEGVLTLEIPGPGDKRHLLFRPAKQAGLVFLSGVKPQNPPEPPAQVMWLRKRLSGRRLLTRASARSLSENTRSPSASTSALRASDSRSTPIAAPRARAATT